MTNYLTWVNFKSLIISKNLLMQYQEFEYFYRISASEDKNLDYLTEIWKDASKVKGINIIQNNIDLVDFENNYKVNCNQSSIGVGGIANVNIPRFRPYLYQFSVDTIVNPNQEIIVFNFDGNGQIDLISLNLENKKWEVILETDIEEVYRLNMEILRGKHNFPTDSSSYIFVDDACKFTDVYSVPIDFTTNFKIKIKNFDTSSKKIRAVLIRYRKIIQ